MRYVLESISFFYGMNIAVTYSKGKPLEMKRKRLDQLFIEAAFLSEDELREFTKEGGKMT
jgi:hypothetical protein